MRDTFDFNGKQYLGHWNSDGVAVVPAALLASKAGLEWFLPAWNIFYGMMWPINNSDFNTYRAENKKGGDLMLFSDVLPIATNFTVEFTEP